MGHLFQSEVTVPLGGFRQSGSMGMQTEDRVPRGHKRFVLMEFGPLLLEFKILSQIAERSLRREPEDIESRQ